MVEALSHSIYCEMRMCVCAPTHVVAGVGVGVDAWEGGADYPAASSPLQGPLPLPLRGGRPPRSLPSLPWEASASCMLVEYPVDQSNQQRSSPFEQPSASQLAVKRAHHPVDKVPTRVADRIRLQASSLRYESCTRRGGAPVWAGHVRPQTRCEGVHMHAMHQMNRHNVHNGACTCTCA
jgi:hypothetical protein